VAEVGTKIIIGFHAPVIILIRGNVIASPIIANCGSAITAAVICFVRTTAIVATVAILGPGDGIAC
jgi:hypothetical protein